jgi:hypothetical protein
VVDVGLMDSRMTLWVVVAVIAVVPKRIGALT